MSWKSDSIREIAETILCVVMACAVILFLVVLIALYLWGPFKEFVEFLRAQEKETIVWWVVGFLFSTWLLTSPLICLFWLYWPVKAKWFWYDHPYISHAIYVGGSFGCVAIITIGAHPFLWFVPDSWIFEHEQRIPFASWLIASAIGLIATLKVWGKLEEFVKQEWQKDGERNIDLQYQRARRDLQEGKTTLAPLIEEIQQLEKSQKEHKLSAFAEERFTALLQVCEALNVRWRREDADPVKYAYADDYYYYPTEPTPNAYGYDGLDGPIEAVEWVAKNVFNDCVKSQQKGKAEMSGAQKEHIKDFLKSLTRTEKAIIVLHYYEEMTIPQVANSLWLPTSKVSRRYSSIIRRCKSHLRKERLS